MTDERDDDDTPHQRDDAAPHPLEIVARVAHEDPAFYRAFRDANGSDPIKAARGLLAMQVLTIQAGEMPGRTYEQLPAHIPDTEKGMRDLAFSRAAADATLKADLFAWARGNKDVHERAAVALATCVGAYLGGLGLLTDADSFDASIEHDVTYLRDHVLRTWHVDLCDAPPMIADTTADAPHTLAIREARQREEIARWAWEAAGKYDVTPDWILTGKQTRNAWKPRPGKAARTGPTTMGNAMRGFTAETADD